MQVIASEMNLSETAFFVPRPGTAKRSEYDLRWFAPLLEVDLCGHVTLASGHLIFKHMQPELEQVTFHTRSGPLGVSRRNDLLELDSPAIASLHQSWVVATAPADAEEYDFVSRFFAPMAGINEDPATGSAHTVLTPYWSARLGKTHLVARQISKRGGDFYCEMAGDRVKITGHTVEVMTGMLDIQI
mgnify:FL=1